MPIRTCVGCRQKAEQAELVRLALVVTSDGGRVVPSRTAPGRGVWVHRRFTCVDRSARGAWKRGFTSSSASAVGDIRTTAAELWQLIVDQEGLRHEHR